MPKISVLIPAYNEEKVIGQCLESLARQTFEDFEVLMIDDCSTDATAEIIRSYTKRYPTKFFLKDYGKVGPGRARNLAAQDARGEIFAFMDADCIATENWLEELMRGFLNQAVGSTGGPHRAPPDSTAFQYQVEDFFKLASPFIGFFKSTPTDEIRETEHNPLCNVAYRADVFRRIGGFREDIWPGEDVAIDYTVKDLGLKITYNPRALVYHHRPETVQQFRKVMHAYGRAQGKLIREFGIRRRLQWIFLFALNVVLITLAFLLVAELWAWLCAGLLALVLIFCIRPNKESELSLALNACQWLNGFAEGFIRNRSEFPSTQSKSH